MSDLNITETPRGEGPSVTLIVRDGVLDMAVLQEWHNYFRELAGGPERQDVVDRIMAAARSGFGAQRRDAMVATKTAAKLLRSMANQLEQRSVLK